MKADTVLNRMAEEISSGVNEVYKDDGITLREGEVILVIILEGYPTPTEGMDQNALIATAKERVKQHELYEHVKDWDEAYEPQIVDHFPLEKGSYGVSIELSYIH